MPVENRAQSILHYQSCTELFQHYRLQCNACFHIECDTHLNTCFDHICREAENQPGSERKRAPQLCVRNYMHLLASSNCTPFYFIQTSRTLRERTDSKRKKKKQNLNYCYCCLFFELATVIIMRCIPFCWQQTQYFTFVSIRCSLSLSKLKHSSFAVCVLLWLHVLLLVFLPFRLNAFQTNKTEKKIYFSPYSLTSFILLIATKRQWMNSTAMHA